MKDVQLSALAPFEEIGDGGQGTVYRLPRSPGWLLKRYHSHIPVNPDELGMLIDRPRRMTDDDRRFVLAATAWPVILVFDRHHCVGFLMSEAPARFGAELAGRAVLRELQYLVYQQRKMWRELRLPSLAERRALVRAYVRLFQVFHRYGVIMGDVSMRNLLWTLEGDPRVFAIDCDGFRLEGRPSALPHAQTPDWADPATPDGRATLDSDRYKLALVVIRVLLTDPRVTPEDIVAVPQLRSDLRSRLDPAVADAVLDLLWLAERPGQRPLAEDWAHALEVSSVRPSGGPSTQILEGRPTLTLDPPKPTPVPQQPSTPQRPDSDSLASSASRSGLGGLGALGGR